MSNLNSGLEVRLLATALMFGLALTANAADTDGDSVDDLLDNCVNVANPLQCDSDSDGYGNRCDGDFDNNGFTNAGDKTYLTNQYDQPSIPPGFNEADINCNGYVNAQDKTLFNTFLSGLPPGPGAEPPCLTSSTWPTACAFHGDNAYDWDVFASHPDCTSTASHIKHINSDGDWNSINDSGYTVFCVAPGDYRGWSGGANPNTILALTQNGTSTQPRWIVLYDSTKPGDRTHPAKLPQAERAIMPHFMIENGDYWQIVRMTVKEYGCEVSAVSCSSGRMRGTTGTRWSHMLIEEGEKSGFPSVAGANNGGGNGNYIFQYNVHRNIQPAVGEDRVAFNIESCNAQPCTIVRNEIINPSSDAITVAYGGFEGGLRIDENEMYITDSGRTNCAGGYDPAGSCAPNEMMIVFKSPRTLNPANSYITNNVIHHTYTYDYTVCCGPGGSFYPAAAINIGSGGGDLPPPYNNLPIQNVIIENNVIFETAAGISFRNDGPAGPGDGASNATIRRNLLAQVSSEFGSNPVLQTYAGYDHLETHNVVVDVGPDDYYLGVTNYLGASKEHTCNVVIEGQDVLDISLPTPTSTYANNYAYGDSTEIAAGTGYSDFGSRTDANHDDLCVVTNFITGPIEHCITDGKVTSTSPHASCGT